MIVGDYPLLHHTRLTGLVSKKQPLPRYASTELFASGGTTDVKTWEYDIEITPGVPANWSAYGAASNPIPRDKVGKGKAFLAVIKEHINFGEEDMLFLRKPGTEHEPYWRELTAKGIRMLQERVARREEQACWDAIHGSFSIDQTTNLRNPIKHSATYAVTSYNSPNVNDWGSSPGKPDKAPYGAPVISSYLPQIMRFYRENTYGLELARFITNAVTAGKLIQNEELRHWWHDSTGGERNRSVLSLMGFSSIGPIPLRQWDAGYTLTDADDATQTYTRHIADNILFGLPAGNEMDARIVEGPVVMPASVIGGDPLQMMNFGYGWFSYAKLNDDPVSLQIHGVRAFGLEIRRPDAILKMTLR